MIIFLLKNPEAVINSMKNGLSLCAKTIVPSLFPFMVLSNLVIYSGLYNVPASLLTPFCEKILGIGNNCASAIILGAFSGFPIGAKTTADLYKNGLCSKEEAEIVMAYSNNASPGFLISCVGASMLGDIRAGKILYSVQLLSAILCGVIMRFAFLKPKNKLSSSKCGYVRHNFDLGIIPKSVGEAGLSLVSVCAFVLFFTVFVDMVSGILSATSCPAIIELIVTGMLELVSGAENSAKMRQALSPRTLRTLLGAFTGFNGISVHMQVILFTSGNGLKLKKYFIGKFIQSIICATLMFFIYTFI